MTKILLVEDDHNLREIYRVRLLVEGYEIVSAGDGEEALALAIQEHPDLILSDVMMPKISGFDMLDILRSTPETADIKVLIMTALSSEDQRQRGEQLGADRYLIKSQVGIEDVIQAVHDVLGDASAATTQADPTPARPYQAVTPGDSGLASLATGPVDAMAGLVADPGATTTAPTSALPEPTAPFSSPRPPRLGERIINPTSDDIRQPDMTEAIARELEQLSHETPPAPSAPPLYRPAPTQSQPSAGPLGSLGTTDAVVPRKAGRTGQLGHNRSGGPLKQAGHTPPPDQPIL